VRAARLGLIVNPIAGIGGQVGLKGSDGAAVVALARSLGGHSVAPERARTALAIVRERIPHLVVLAPAGVMGGDAATALGLQIETVSAPPPATTAADTRIAAAAARDAGADLLLFAGGDGTAADLLGIDLPALGVPAGVKMYSSVFATGPRAAAEIVASYLADPRPDRCEPREVMDVDEAAIRRDERFARLLGTLLVPAGGAGLQSLKTMSLADDVAATERLAVAVIRRLQPGDLVVLGPGTTTAAIARGLGLRPTLLGVDLLEIEGDGRARVLAADAPEAQLLVALAARPATIVVSPTGGQGFVLGRGNQQISPAVVRAVGPERLVVVATPAKLATLGGRPLLVDTGDEALDASLAGYRRVITGPGAASVVEVRRG